MKTLIAPSHLHPSIRLKMMEEANQNYLIEWKFLSWSQFLKEKDNGLMPHFKAYNLLKELNLSIFHKMIDYPYFIEQLLKMLKLCCHYDISMDSLDEDTLTNKELKGMLMHLYPHLHDAYKLNFSFDNAENIMIYPFYQDLLEQQMATLLLEQGATLYQGEQCSACTRKLFKALNPQQEIESIAQLIIQQELDTDNIQIACASTTYFPLIRHIFKRYQLPFHFIIPIKKKLLSSKQFIALYTLYDKQNLTSFVDCLSLAIFPIEHIQEYQRYLSACVSELNQCLNEFNYYQNIVNTSLFPNEFKDFVELELLLAEDQKIIMETLNKLFNASDTKEAFLVIFDIIQNSCPHEECLKLKSFLERNFHYLQEDNLDIFFYHLENLSLSETQMDQGIAITDIVHPLLYSETLFIIGLDQKKYPHFNAHNGYFDERYFKNLNYPNEEERFDHHLKQLEWLFNQSSTQYFSYAFADISGKPKELSYHIEKRLNLTAQLYPLVQNDLIQTHVPYLSKEKAQQLFFKDNIHQSNVYKLETYFACPYRYYLQNGLKLNKESNPYPIKKLLGTINHDVIQQAKNAKEIDTLISPWITQLDKLYPTKSKNHQLLRIQNIHHLNQSVKHLQSFNQSHPYQHQRYEVAIDQTFKMDDITFIIKGFIDCLQEFEDYIRIIDYKSSDYVISLSKVLDGTKLQLATYMYCQYLNQTKKIPSALIYYSMSQTYYQRQRYNASYGQLKVIDDETMELNYLKLNKCSGLFFNDLDHQGDAQYLSGLQAKRMVNVLDLFNYLDQIYTLFIQHLKQADIEIDPNEGTCAYCDYARICRFNRLAKTPTALILAKEENHEVE
ncbi:MAG: PD-(D/E)XK nuclease family protein [Erysipelotrichaceae bacterium]